MNKYVMSICSQVTDSLPIETIINSECEKIDKIFKEKEEKAMSAFKQCDGRYFRLSRRGDEVYHFRFKFVEESIFYSERKGEYAIISEEAYYYERDGIIDKINQIGRAACRE